MAAPDRPTPPDPRTYAESAVVAFTYFYRDPNMGTIAVDGTFVPLQTAPTDPTLLAAFLGTTAPPSSVQQGYSGHHRGPTPAHRHARRSPSPHDSRCPPSPPRRDDHRGYAPPHRPFADYRGGRTEPPQRRYDPVGPSSRRGEYDRNYNAPAQYAPRYAPRDAGNYYSEAPTRYSAPPHASYQARGAYTSSRGSNTRGGNRAALQERTHDSSPRTTPAQAAVPASAGPFVPIPPPDVTQAVRSVNGHPEFPVLDDESDYEGSDDADTATQNNLIWVRRDADRIRKAGINISSRTEGKNILRWSGAGCPYAYAAAKHIQQWYGLQLLLQRSTGVGVIMSSQEFTKRHYVMATTGSIPLSQKQRAMAAANTSSAPTAAAPAPPVADIEMPPAPSPTSQPPAFRPAFLGSAAPGVDMGVLNSRSTIDAATAHWALIPTSHWYRGMWNAAGDYPTAVHDTPAVDDVRAVLTIELWTPEDDDTKDARLVKDEFIGTSLNMFSCQGMFARYAREGGYPVGSRGPEHYAFMTATSSWAHAACWWSAHGLAHGTPDEAAMELFATSWRNQPLREGPWNTVWSDYPQSVACVASLDSDAIIPYADLQFPPLHPDLSSDFPRRPASASVDEDEAMT
ncbi:hypothetical protein B0H17DRAFT_1150170 [Mycena rosella]|uniref:Uncharacterized protein n=1 Tax=Mycena rosella TaxID=1033263 RepID=A0AAD7BWL8_MYCRO|nr:hypothetical protein B0H17DRAFT_1150170 [Mycena rosella]